MTMRNPSPQAVLSAILQRRSQDNAELGPYQVAVLASDIARLGKAATRYGVAWCNGEQWPGQIDALHRARLPQAEHSARLSAVHAEIEKLGEKLEAKTAKMNERLAPFGVVVTTQGDPRGHCLKVYDSSDTAKDRALWSI
jgi:hypothetical protein